MEGQNSFSGWAIIEMMGHRREIGYVTTEHYGAASLFRVDSPQFEEREFELTKPQYVDGVLARAGSKVKRAGIPAKSCLVGPGSIYALNPCTEETARQAIEEGIHRPLIPEFGTGANAHDVRNALIEVRKEITRAIGTEKLKNIVELVHGRSGPIRDFHYSERELRIIRFAIDRALESI